MEIEELDDRKGKTWPVQLLLGNFCIPFLSLFPSPPAFPLVRRRVLAMRLAGSLGALTAVVLSSPAGFAQANAQADKASEIAKSQNEPASLSRDLSGVWMQYQDGDVPGTPGMNGVNERFRPP